MAVQKEIVTVDAFQNFIKTFLNSIYDWEHPHGYDSSKNPISSQSTASGDAYSKETGIEPLILATNKDIEELFS